MRTSAPFAFVLAALVAGAGVSASSSALAYYPPPPVAPPPGYAPVYAPPPPPYYAPPEYGEVLQTQPIYRVVRVNVPQQQCYQQQVVYDNDRGNTLAGTLIGGLIGGVVGNQFGRGSGRVLATAGGAVVGASVGNNVGRANDGPPQVGYQQRCDTVNAFHDEQQIDGYDVTYRYGGRVYHTRLSYDPGPQIPVNVNVAPAAY